MNALTRLFTYTYLLALAISVPVYANDDAPQPKKTLWQWVFGSPAPSQKQTCDNCKNGPPRTIDNAHLVNGGGTGQPSGSGSPTQINNLHGNINSSGVSGSSGGGNIGGGGGSAGLSEQAVLALKREETRQLELANQRALNEEHERNKWFNTLVQFVDERWTQQAKELLDTHHEKLEQIEKKRGEIELEKEQIRKENLPQLLAHDLEKNKQNHMHALEKMDMVGRGLHTFLGDPQRLGLVSAALAGLVFAGYVSKRSTAVAARYIQAQLMKPSLVTETSRRTFSDSLRSPLSFLKKEETLPPTMHNKTLRDRIDRYVQSIRAGSVDGQPFRHALFYGAPGTGKTLLARKIAHELDMHYAIIPGANIHQFGDEAVKELNHLFDWAETASKQTIRAWLFEGKKRKGTVLFIDEVDALAPRRSATMSELMRKIQNTLYARTGTETNKFLLLGATNAQALLDSAYMSRMDEKIEFELPDRETRVNLIRLYVEKYIKNDGFKIDPKVETMYEEIATTIEGFSGREISQLARAFRAHAYSEKNALVTPQLVRSVVKERVEQHNKTAQERRAPCPV